MTAGETFAVSGYALVASAQYAVGGGGQENEVVVLNNNSTHYLVATREAQGATATLHSAYRYADVYDESEDHPDGCLAAYRKALYLMLQIALAR